MIADTLGVTALGTYDGYDTHAIAAAACAAKQAEDDALAVIAIMAEPIAPPLTLEAMQGALNDHRSHRRDLAHARDASREQRIIDAFTPTPIGQTGASSTQDGISQPFVPDANTAPAMSNEIITAKILIDRATRPKNAR
jgi:hypothetical protein